MAILACTAAFGVLQIISGTLLQGLGAERAPVYYLLVAVAVKIGLNLALMPLWGIHGAAVAAVAAYATAAALNCIRLRRMLPTRLAWGRDAAKPAAAAALMAAGLAAWLGAAALALAALPAAPPERAAQTAVALSAVALGGVIYAAALLRARAVTAAELAALPKHGPKLISLLRKLRILPHEERNRFQ
jgi:O-antigen/teichoic acid export membrane protein